MSRIRAVRLLEAEAGPADAMAMRFFGWRTFLVFSSTVIFSYPFLSPSGLARALVYEALITISVVGVFAGARRQPRGKRAAWYWMGAGLSSFLAGDVIYSSWELVFGTIPPYPSVGDFFYLANFPLFAIGIAKLIRARTPGRDRASLIDAAIVATGAGVVAWVFLMQPYVSEGALTVMARVLLTAYPAMDVLVLAAVARLAIGQGLRPPAFYLLAAATTAVLITDAMFGLQVLAGTFSVDGNLNMGWMMFYVLVAAAALHPSSAQLYERAAVEDERLTRSRLVLLAGASLLAPASEVLSGRDHGSSVSVASAALFLLVVARMAGLLRVLEASMAKVAELQRRRGERRFQALVQSAADVVLVLDSQHLISFASPSAERSLGLDPTGWSGEGLLSLLHADDAEALLSSVEAIELGPTSSARPVSVRFAHPDGTERHLEVLLTNLLSDPDVEGIVLNARDVTERAELEQQLRHLAFHDPVTGLANRALFGDRVEHALHRAERSRSKVAVLFCDIDNFKTVNDSLGHEAGDQMLTVAAERLSHCIRPGDTVARLGGDEFGILLEDLTIPEQVSQIAERMLAEFRLPWCIDGSEVVLSASIGVAFSSTELDVSDLLRNADAAMYEAKSRGKDGWRLYEPRMHALALDRLHLAADLRNGLERNEFFLVYQPVIDLVTDEITGVEALVRWQHPERGVVAPADFISIAEASGSITDLGRWVLREACRQAATWRSTIPEASKLRISVNVSARQIQDGDFTETVTAALEEADLDPDRLVLELTESVLLKEPEKAMVAFGELKKLGVRLAIDDFGTGYSSLSYLQRLPVDIIKIDKSFVDNVGIGSEFGSLAGGIVELIKTLGVEAIAEGIESASQVTGLKATGCRWGQGFYFARPMEPDALVAALTANRSSVAG